MIIHGDSLEKLKEVGDDSVDLLCTDPPYGYSFMGKSWDKTLPDIGIFKESFRVLKPGAFAFVMSAPRSDVCARMMLLLEDAGFEIGFTPIYWTYASGFPKAMNIGKMVDKRLGVERSRQPLNERELRRNITTRAMEGREDLVVDKPDGNAISPEAKALDGSYGGFQPKPAVEVVIVAMKPLSEKTFVDQALKNGKGITWLDDCRVPTSETFNTPQSDPTKRKGEVGSDLGISRKDVAAFQEAQAESIRRTQEMGRFPANLLVSDDVLNDGRITKSAVTIQTEFTSKNAQGFQPNPKAIPGFNQHGDSGSYSRYFDLDAWAKTLPFLIVPKASKREKNEGLDGFEKKQSLGGGGITSPENDDGEVVVSGDKGTAGKYGSAKAAAQNHHPTVKPLTLMSYLITLGSRPGDVVLDPFLGSGTTALAAKQLGRKYVGIEREKEYVEIAEARLKTIENALL